MCVHAFVHACVHSCALYIYLCIHLSTCLYTHTKHNTYAHDANAGGERGMSGVCTGRKGAASKRARQRLRMG